MVKNFRFAREWKVDTKYKGSDYAEIYRSSELLCPKLTAGEIGDCLNTTDTFFSIEKTNIKAADTVKLSNIGKDTRDTYSFSLRSIEFYGQFIKSFTNSSQIKFITVVFLFIFII